MIINTLLMTWGVIITLMTIVWIIFMWKKNPGIIDVFWSIAIFISALLLSSIDINNPIKLIFQLILAVWAVRLSSYLFLKRIVPQHLDQRYEDLSQKWRVSKNIGFFFNFQFQGILAIIISTPFIFIKEINQINLISLVSIILIIISIIGESIADLQLQKFKKLKTKNVCDVGLWRYSRHPNYFFEWMIWLGFALAGITFPFGWLGLASPLLLLLLMLKVTGPITEQGSIKSRGNKYLVYQKKTSMFVPWPPKKEK